MCIRDRLNTLGVDRDRALEMAIRGEQTRDFTEMNGEVAVGLSSGTSGHRGVCLLYTSMVQSPLAPQMFKAKLRKIS